jgi:hypothetical protein
VTYDPDSIRSPLMWLAPDLQPPPEAFDPLQLDDELLSLLEAA